MSVNYRKYKKTLYEIEKLKRNLVNEENDLRDLSESLDRVKRNMESNKNKMTYYENKMKTSTTEYDKYLFDYTALEIKFEDAEINRDILIDEREQCMKKINDLKQMIKQLEQQVYEMETLERVVRKKKIPPGVDKRISDLLTGKENTLSPLLRF